MKTIQVSKPGGPLELVEREIPAVKRDWVRIKVQACGVCHSDMMMKEGQWLGTILPTTGAGSESEDRWILTTGK